MFCSNHLPYRFLLYDFSFKYFPGFVSYQETKAGATIVTVSAMDKDAGENARISYFLSESADLDTKNMFAVEEDTGVVTVLHDLEKKGGREFRLEVIAR